MTFSLVRPFREGYRMPKRWGERRGKKDQVEMGREGRKDQIGNVIEGRIS